MAIDADDIITVDGQAVIQGGDFLVDPSDQQHIEHIIKAKPGQYYQHPLLGYGIIDQVSSSQDPYKIKQDIKLQLKADNYRPTQVIVSPQYEISIDAQRIK